MSCQPWLSFCPICDAPDGDEEDEFMACIEAHERPPEPEDFETQERRTDDVKALVEEAREAIFSDWITSTIAPGAFEASLTHAYGANPVAERLIARLADALSARASSDAEKRDAVLEEAARVAKERAATWRAEKERYDPEENFHAFEKLENGEVACIETATAILSLRTPPTMSETMTPGEMVEALEKRAPYYRAWAKDIRALNGTSVDADHADATARDLEAAAAFIRSTMEAVEPFARDVDALLASTPDDHKVNGIRLGDLRRLRTLTGATDER